MVTWLQLRNVGPCYHGMARLRLADGGDGLQIRRAVANIHIEYAVADNQQGVVLQLGAWVGGWHLLTINKQLLTKCYKGPQNWLVS